MADMLGSAPVLVKNKRANELEKMVVRTMENCGKSGDG